MWLITPTGFFSIVCKPGDEELGALTTRCALLDPTDVQVGRHEVHLCPAQVHQFRDA
jgi:hypothetical protein